MVVKISVVRLEQMKEEQSESLTYALSLDISSMASDCD